MSPRIGVWLFLCLILAQAGVAQDLTASFTIVSFHVKDIKTNSPIVSTPVVISAQNMNTGYKEQNADYIDAEGILIYKLTPGNWLVQLRIDNTTTEQVDFFAEQIINIQPQEPLLNKSFFVRSVGVVRGTVLDSKGKPAGDADLSFQCKAGSNFEYPGETDKFGTFQVELPIGRCKIAVAYQGDVGSATIDVEQGSFIQTTIQIGKRQSLLLFVLVPLGIGVIGYLVYHFIKRRVAKEVTKEIKKEIHKESKEKIERKEPEQTLPKTEEIKKVQEKDELNPRARDIMKTLNEREQQIVHYLLSNNYMGTQANIRNHTGIPKTSLVRAFQALEDKKVLSVEKIGKMKKVRLTDWFLGKE